MKRWAYGVTSVKERVQTLLPRTLHSLKAAGFDEPHLFIDDVKENPLTAQGWTLQSTCRWPKIRTYGNWILGLAELYIRNPGAERYAMFQDDTVTSRNLRAYLDACPWPCRSYLNLYTFASNQLLAPKRGPSMPGNWFEAREIEDGPVLEGGKRFQTGRGAVALCFTREAVLVLLKHQHIIEHVMDVEGWRRIDGSVVSAMNKAGWREFVHDPSLVQHVGKISMTNPKNLKGEAPHKQATSFMGEDYDLLQLLPKRQ